MAARWTGTYRHHYGFVVLTASNVTADFDWWAIAERLAGIVGEPLVAGQLSAPLN